MAMAGYDKYGNKYVDSYYTHHCHDCNEASCYSKCIHWYIFTGAVHIV